MTTDYAFAGGQDQPRVAVATGWYGGSVKVAIGLPAIGGPGAGDGRDPADPVAPAPQFAATVARDDIPDKSRLTLDQAEPLLTGLSFHSRYSTVSRRSVATEGDQKVFTDVYEHADGRAHALATPSMTPEQGEPCSA